MVGYNGKFGKTGVPRGAPPSESELGNDGDTDRGGRGVNMDRSGRGDLKAMCLHNEQSYPVLHQPAQYPTWV